MDTDILTDQELEEQARELVKVLMCGCYRENAAVLEELVSRFRSMRMACDALKAGLDQLDGQLNMIDAEVLE